MDTILFDLDGTLLPMDQDLFIDTYFKGVAKKLIPYGIDPKTFIGAIWKGTRSMMGNDGTITNENRFWKTITELMGEKIRSFEPVFYDYYQNEFKEVKSSTRPSPLARECVSLLKNKGYRIVLATNPLFPWIATHNRIRWAGLEPEDFEHITTFEHYSYCKPSINYYEQLLTKIGREAKQCIMIGNDVREDMIVRTIGMETFLVTDCLINVDGENIDQYKNGSLAELVDFIKNFPEIV